MKKAFLTIASIALIAGLVADSALAGASGVSDPTITVNEFTPSGGKSAWKKVHDSLDSLETAIEAAIDVLDLVSDGSGLAGSGTLVDVAITGSIEPDIVVVTDTNAYTVLDNNSGQVHIVPDLTADCTITMPAEAANQYYKFVYAGGAADGQDWIIDTGTNSAYFVGGLTQIDVTGVGTNVVTQYYSDGNSNSKLGVLTPEAGTVVELWCEDGTTWYVSGTVYSDTDTGVTFADQ
jgi:hypothetical protein